MLVAKALATHPQGHGGGPRFIEGGPEHEALLDFYDLAERAVDPDCTEEADDVPGYRDIFGRFDLRSAEQTWRAFTVQALGRLPTEDEVRHIRAEDGGAQVGPDNGQRPGDGDRGGDLVLTASADEGLRVVYQMILEALAADEAKPWLKDMWNDVFLFRGIHAQELNRAYEVFNPHDYGARHWSDLCDVKTFETDAGGEFVIGPGRQAVCNLEHERFAYPEVGQPHADGREGYGGQDVLASVEACDYCAFTRRGIANLMLYGAVEEPLELIADTIQRGRPFTEIVTSEDLMMNYYTSLVYFGTADPAANDFTADMADVPRVDGFHNGPNFTLFDVEMPDHRVFKRMNRMRRTKFVYDREHYDVVDEFGDPILDDDGAPVTDFGNIRYLTYQSELNEQEPDSFPRAGLLTSTAFMTRFTSNDFNLHRQRAWQALRLFLGYDILENQGDRVSLAGLDDPNDGVTMSNDDCSNCHERLDPIAGLFKDFFTAGHSRRPEVADAQWPDIIHAPGWPSLDGEDSVLHNRADHGAPIRLLAEQIAASPRFPRTMVGYAWRQVMGSEPPETVVDPGSDHFEARSTLLIAQDRFFDSLVHAFVRNGFDMAPIYARL
ncbi:MAG: hypothetical protein VX516_06110, partial [Actinomycetota bacterium]|nr:hypothetical protein [Actinomycetota bacterium]